MMQRVYQLYRILMHFHVLDSDRNGINAALIASGLRLFFIGRKGPGPGALKPNTLIYFDIRTY